MVSEGARPWGRGRSEFANLGGWLFGSVAFLGGRFGFSSGRGKGEPEAPDEGGTGPLSKIPGAGGGVSRSGRGRWAGRMSAANWGILGGRGG